MINSFSDEINVQLLVALLKEHGIRKIIASPGSANSPFVASLQFDGSFEIYSSVDERSAAYIACGLASESGEPVVISCTGATASRNYASGLTEAYYRKLPIIAITSTRSVSQIGHLVNQIIDRSQIQKDVANLSVLLPIVNDDDTKWECEIKINQSLLELKRRGGGPVHINLQTNYCKTFTTKSLPVVRKICRFTHNDDFPALPCGKVVIFVGSHKVFSKEETMLIEQFCAKYDSLVLCDHTSGYYGQFKILFPLMLSQVQLDKSDLLPEIVIHIGEISALNGSFLKPKIVWRVSEDGELRDTMRSLVNVFETNELSFFEYYVNTNTRSVLSNSELSYFESWSNKINEIRLNIPDLPFSNIWVAQRLSKVIPKYSVMHFGILNSLSSWNFFNLHKTIRTSSNVGGFGIDGCVSTLLGASLSNPENLYIGVVGDLAFFYDMNVLGNRHMGNNIRIILINNGKGVEFKIKDSQTVQFGDDTDTYISASGHFGSKSPLLVKSYVESLGFEYISASTKFDFDEIYVDFLKVNSGKPIVFEIFTNDIDEQASHEMISTIMVSVKNRTKHFAKKIFGIK